MWGLGRKGSIGVCSSVVWSCLRLSVELLEDKLSRAVFWGHRAVWDSGSVFVRAQG